MVSCMAHTTLPKRRASSSSRPCLQCSRAIAGRIGSKALKVAKPHRLEGRLGRRLAALLGLVTRVQLHGIGPHLVHERCTGSPWLLSTPSSGLLLRQTCPRSEPSRGLTFVVRGFGCGWGIGCDRLHEQRLHVGPPWPRLPHRRKASPGAQVSLGRGAHLQG
jgi:hypothetical protein